MDVQFVDLPDLQVTGISPPEETTMGQGFSLTYEVKNSGQGPVPDRQAEWTDYVYLSRDTYLDARSDHFVGQVAHAGILDPQQTSSVSRSSWSRPIMRSVELTAS